MVTLDFEDLKRDGENTQKGLALFVSQASSRELYSSTRSQLLDAIPALGDRQEASSGSQSD